MPRLKLGVRGLAAALFLSALTIRPCPALFNFRSKNILAKHPSTWRARQPISANLKNAPVSFPAPAIYNRQFHNQPSFQPRSHPVIEINFPSDLNTNLLMLLRWLHFIGGITWVGLLFFFNLVNVPFMKELDPATKGKVLPSLMTRALWWFRWGSVLTVLMGLAYWGSIVASDARNGGSTSGVPMGSFFGIWTVAWALMYACQIPGKGPLDKGPVLAVLYAVIVVAASVLFLRFNNHGWESNRLLAIGIGGGMGWVMMLNVWGVIWRAQKKIIQWTADNATSGTPMPDKAKYLARQAFLTSRANFVLAFPMLFFMAAASHYPMFGG
jgi:uncharacterized membrane protein